MAIKTKSKEMDFNRQFEIFPPEKYKDCPLDIIGSGATGSYIIWLLAKVGMTNIHVWDPKKVAEHNLPNQCFMLSQIGKYKAKAAAEMVKRSVGIDIIPHSEEVVKLGNRATNRVVFLLTDTMPSRKAIWESSLKMNITVKRVIETRMGSKSGRVYLVNPCDPNHIRGWEETLCNDDEAEVSLCGTSLSIACTASLIASMAVWQLIKYLGQKEEVENELIVSTSPWATMSRFF